MSASEAQLLAAWPQLARLRPRMAAHARTSLHRYRGEDWFVVEDPASGQVHRLRPDAQRVPGPHSLSSRHWGPQRPLRHFCATVQSPSPWQQPAMA